VTPEESAALDAHNARVKALAGIMPPGPLNHAVCVIGYRADKHTGITAGYSIPTMARLSKGKPWEISARELDRGIRTLAQAGVIKITHPPARDGKRQANSYMIDYEWRDTERIAEAWEMGRRERRRKRQQANGVQNRTPSASLTLRETQQGIQDRIAPADDEAARLEALDAYPEPPEPLQYPGCGVCNGTHDLTHDYDLPARMSCRICLRHKRERHPEPST
jgi:hypothetical protein